MSDCLFCKIAAGEIPANKIYEDDNVLAFYDIAPQAPVHFLVIPKKHLADLSEIAGDIGNTVTAANCLETCADLAKQLGLGSYRVVSNIGAEAGQSVFHLHFHVLGGRELGRIAG
ncbi:MAG: histidine triad nucleotide-binding protein [Firmicutes bacterium]|nr:histidine triad nucleotide-binding protein [Bacillota bacterium]